MYYLMHLSSKLIQTAFFYLYYLQIMSHKRRTVEATACLIKYFNCNKLHSYIEYINICSHFFSIEQYLRVHFFLVVCTCFSYVDLLFFSFYILRLFNCVPLFGYFVHSYLWAFSIKQNYLLSKLITVLQNEIHLP